MSLYDDASLIMYPSGYKEDKIYSLKPTDGSGDLTFTRASTATRVNADGLIEKVRTNLVINSVWDGVGTNIAPTSWGIGFTSGNFEAATNTEDAFSSAIRFFGTAARRYITQSSPVGTYIASFYVNAATTGLRIDNVVTSLSGSSISFLEDGLSISATKIIEAGKWYSIIFTNASISEFRIGGGVGSNGTYDFTISMPQWETGDVRTEYIPTTTTAVSVGMLADVPRIDYTGGNCGKLLLEPQRTNLVTYSSEFDNANWAKSGVDATANNTTSPDGTTNADKLANQLGTTGYLSQTISLSSSTIYTTSVFAKNAGIDNLFIYLSGSGGNANCTFNLTTLSTTPSAGVTAKIEDYGNGWYRCSATFTASSTGASGFRIYPSFTTGDGTSGVYLYGAQAESGSYSTSYIPCPSSSSVTRLADSASKTGISSLINSAEGVLYLETNTFENGGASKRISLSDGNANEYNRLTLEFDESANTLKVFMTSGGNLSALMTATGIDQSVNNKIALKYNATSVDLYVNGVLKQTAATSASTPIALSVLKFSEPSNNHYFYGKVKNLIVFPSALSDTDLATLTTL